MFDHILSLRIFAQGLEFRSAQLVGKISCHLIKLLVRSQSVAKDLSRYCRSVDFLIGQVVRQLAQRYLKLSLDFLYCSVVRIQSGKIALI